MEKYYVMNIHTGEVVFESANVDECRAFCYDVATRENWGMYRYWVEDNCETYDCGPRIYKILGNHNVKKVA